MLNSDLVSTFKQIPLILTVDEDDKILSNSPDAHWYQILKDLPWEDYRSIGADYYNALYHFNKTKRKPRNDSRNNESKEKAVQRLLFERATMDEDAPVLFEKPSMPDVESTVSPSSISPGSVPNRLGGKKPKCFFSLLKSFIGAPLMGFKPVAEEVHSLLSSNLSFARVCGFVPKGQDEEYWYKNVPRLRKLQQFDQIMTAYGLWDRIKRKEVSENINQGVIKKENVLVGDTSHYHAYSRFQTVTHTDKKSKKKTKSQSIATKNCRCKDRENCHHDWQLADDGAGTIVKAHNKMIWGHKASILGLPSQGIPLDAVAVADAATHDSETLFPHVVDVFQHYPIVEQWIDTVIYDKASDSQPLKEKFKEQLNLDLKTSLNPRRRKDVTKFLPKGMEKITPYGNVICNAGRTMDYRGIRYKTEKFIYKAPVDENDVSVCATCEHKPTCCPNSTYGRIVEISFDMLPHINSQDPPMAKRFKAIMKLRPSVERMIKRLKCDLSDDRLSQRSNASFQAYLDKTMIAFHILLRN